jgi:hypothetical protein
MSHKGIIFDRLKPVWDTLTSEQKICWHFTAAQRPSLNAAGELRTENGWQYFVDVNSPLAVVDPDYILTDPPANTEPPPPITVTAGLWPIPSKPASGPSTRKPTPFVNPYTQGIIPTIAVVTQTYDTFLDAHNIRPATGRITTIVGEIQTFLRTNIPNELITFGKNFTADPIHEAISSRPRVRHVTTIEAPATAPVPLNVPQGYYATTAGINRFATIRGVTARRRPDLPLGKLRVINTTNGVLRTQTIPNPTGTT